VNSNNDPYPSRGEGLAPRLPRVEPVLHQGGAVGPLTPDQLTHYDRNGYLTLGDLFAPAEVAQMAGELDRLRADERVRQSEIGVTEPMSGEIRSISVISANAEIQ
jgi:ectoine hydroxylase